jgi:hypothetical protein
MKGYTTANTAHQKHVKQMGFEKEYFIPNLPEYMYEIAKFRWVPSPKDKEKNGYYEGIARVHKADGAYTHVRVSLLTQTMVKLFGTEAQSAFIRSLKSKAIDDTLVPKHLQHDRPINVASRGDQDEWRTCGAGHPFLDDSFQLVFWATSNRLAPGSHIGGALHQEPFG